MLMFQKFNFTNLKESNKKKELLHSFIMGWYEASVFGCYSKEMAAASGQDSKKSYKSKHLITYTSSNVNFDYNSSSPAQSSTSS
jgi:hypothetical protein